MYTVKIADIQMAAFDAAVVVAFAQIQNNWRAC